MTGGTSPANGPGFGQQRWVPGQAAVTTETQQVTDTGRTSLSATSDSADLEARRRRPDFEAPFTLMRAYFSSSLQRKSDKASANQGSSENVPESSERPPERSERERGSLQATREALIKVQVGQKNELEVSEGTGPVDAFNMALRKALIKAHPEVVNLTLSNFTVVDTTPERGTAANVLVTVTLQDKRTGGSITMACESDDLFQASALALCDAVELFLLRERDSQTTSSS